MAKPKTTARRPRKRGKPHSANLIAKAMAMLVAGSTVEEVSEKLDVPKQTVSDWKKEIPAEFGQVRTKKETIEELLTQYLQEGLQATLAQMKVFSDAEWIKKQNAADLATLHGVLFDKFSRVFDAAKRGAEQQQSQQPGRLNPAPED